MDSFSTRRLPDYILIALDHVERIAATARYSKYAANSFYRYKQCHIMFQSIVEALAPACG